MVGPLIPVLADHYGVGLSKIGFALSLNALGIFVASLFSGIIAERTGKRNIFISGMVIYIISFLGIYFSTDFIYFILSYILFGLSWGIIVVNSFAIISDLAQFDGGRSIMRLRIGLVMGSLLTPLAVSAILYIDFNWKNLFLTGEGCLG